MKTWLIVNILILNILVGILIIRHYIPPEGILTISPAGIPPFNTDVYEGGSKQALLGINLRAEHSPIKIERIKLNLSESRWFYTRYFQTLYLVSDTGEVLAESFLNSDTVKQSYDWVASNDYYLTWSGFSYTVPDDNSVHILTIKGDLYDFIPLFEGMIAISVDRGAISGVDRSGIEHSGPDDPNRKYSHDSRINIAIRHL